MKPSTISGEKSQNSMLVTCMSKPQKLFYQNIQLLQTIID